jgi:uncharacterized protein YdeI (YjbR/CyaY-like superfamily)
MAPGTASPKPKFFRNQEEFRAWLAKNHHAKSELWVGYYKKTSGKLGMVYREAVDEALCFGWIDGVVRSIDGERYMQRFTPRKPASHWSFVNVKRFGELEAAGKVAPAGKAAFERKTPERTGQASYEQPLAEFTAAQRKEFKANAKAWAFYESQPPGYRRVVQHFVTRAKQEATRKRRLELVIKHSAKGERIPQLISPAGER